MNKNWKPAFAVLAVTALLFGQGIGHAYAQGTTSAPASQTAAAGAPVFSFANLAKQKNAIYTSNGMGQTPGTVVRFINESLTLGGVQEAADYYYSVPRTSIGANSYLEINFSHSELLLAARSTLTISVDDKPLKSIFLTKETAAAGSIRIPLGAEETSSGFHKLTISKQGELTDDLCDDQSNPANWVKIGKSSHVFLDSHATASSADLLQDFPLPFVEPGNLTEIYSTIVVPDTADADVVAAALRVATSLSAKTATHAAIPILTESEWSAKGNLTHVIAIGSPEAWNGPLKTLAAEQGISARDQKLGIDTFQMRINQSATAKLLMLISRGKGTDLEQSIHVLTDPALNKQLAGNQLVLQNVPELPRQQTKQSGQKLTLESAGYSHILLRQGEDSEQQIVLSLPSNWKVTGDVTLDLKLRVSPLLMQTEGSEKEKKPQQHMTVTINGVPHTVLLQELKATDKNDGYQLRLPIDPSLLEEGNRTLNLAFSASLEGKEAACLPVRDSGKWVFVDKESALSVPHQTPSLRSFQYWPAPLVQEQGLSQTAFLLPEKLTGTYLSHLSLLLNEMADGKELQADAFTVFREPLQPQDLQKIAAYHVVAMGDLQQYPTLKAAQRQLLIHQPKTLERYHVINETTRFVAWIQPSLWNQQRTLTVFQSAEGGDQAQAAFVHPTLLTYLKNTHDDGQIVVMSKSNEVFTIQVDEKAEETGLDEAVGNIPLWLIGVVLLVFLILLGIYIRMLKIEKKKAKRRG